MSNIKFKFWPDRANAEKSGLLNIQKRSITLPQNRREIWAVGGGKGGIGKTLLTSNMAVFLTWLNQKVVLIDMDLGGANLHTSIGAEAPAHSLSDLLTGKTDNIQDLIAPTAYRNLSLISGAHDPLGIANLPHIQKQRLLRKFREIDADFILLDLGAGTSNNTLDFFLLADRRLIVTTPEPTSVENAYRFIKGAFYRELKASAHNPWLKNLIEQAMDSKNQKGIKTPKNLLEEITRLSPEEGKRFAEHMADFHLHLILNQTRSQQEAELGKSIQLVCERFFGIQVDYVGALPYDNAIWQSIRHRVPFLVEAPNSTATTHLEGIVRNLFKPEKVKQDKAS